MSLVLALWLNTSQTTAQGYNQTIRNWGSTLPVAFSPITISQAPAPNNGTHGVSHALYSDHDVGVQRSHNDKGRVGTERAARAGRFVGLTPQDMFLAALVVGVVTALALLITNGHSAHS